MWDDELNSTIDEVARQMTEAPADGGADFRRRVLGRIEAGEAPRQNRRAVWLVAPLAVAAAIVVAVLVAPARGPRPNGTSGPNVPALPTPETSARAGRESDPSASQRPETARDSARRVEAPAARRRFELVPTPTGSAPEIAVLDVVPLTVDSIAVPVIVTDSMQLPKLDATAPIGVTPLGRPSEGDRP